MPAEIPPALPEKKVFPVIDDGVYQAVVTEVESGKQKTYDDRFNPNAPETESFYVFKFKILTPGPAQGRLLWSRRGKAVLPVPPEGKQKPSLTYLVASAVKGRRLTFDEGKKWSLADINALAGQQIVLVVQRAPKQGGDGEINSITAYMHAGTTLPDIDEQNGGAENPPTPPAPTEPPPTPDRYRTVPPEFQPKPVEERLA